MRHLAPVLAVLLAAAPASAQAAARVVQDGWSVRWVAGKKAAWSHERCEERPDGFLRTARQWIVARPGAPVVREDRVETDREGRIVRQSIKQTGPFGAIEATAERAEGGLTYRVVSRALEPVEGRIEGDVWDAGVVTILTTSGELSPVVQRCRSVSCVTILEDGSFVEVVVIGLDMDLDAAAFERILGSVRWAAGRPAR